MSRFEKENKNNWIEKAKQKKRDKIDTSKKRAEQEKKAKEHQIKKEAQDKKIIEITLSKFIAVFKNYQIQLKNAGYIDSNEDLKIEFGFLSDPFFGSSFKKGKDTDIFSGFRSYEKVFGPSQSLTGSDCFSVDLYYGMKVVLARNIEFELYLTDKREIAIRNDSTGSRSDTIIVSNEHLSKKFTEEKLSDYIESVPNKS